MTANPRGLALEAAAQTFVEATDTPPYLYEIAPADGRTAVDEVQSSDIYKPDIDEKWITIPGGPTGEVQMRIVRPAGVAGPLPVIIYTHGAGWVFGNAHTHDRLVRDLAIGSGAAVVFPEYDRSPEAKFPVAIEQVYTATKWAAIEGAAEDLDGSRIAVAGDSVGGNMTIALTLLAKQRAEFTITQQVLFYPVTDAAFDTGSYHEFAEGYFLRRDGMKWFWDQYTTDETERASILASPLRASIDHLRNLPPALIITAEADVLRDEGEQYAAKLREAGVPTTAVRYLGIVHDFVMLNTLHDTQAARAAIAQAAGVLRDALN
jgi:acetyl esterase/lipase